MITEAILSALFGVADILCGLLPEIEWTLKTSAWEYVRDIMSMIAYMLPMGHIKAAIALIIAVAVFRIFVALGRSIIDSIPFI